MKHGEQIMPLQMAQSFRIFKWYRHVWSLVDAVLPESAVFESDVIQLALVGLATPVAFAAGNN